MTACGRRNPDSLNWCRSGLTHSLMLAALSLATPLCAAEPSRLYDRQVNVPLKIRPVLQAAVKDLQSTLRQVTGAEFTTLAGGEPRGIVLRRAGEPKVPAAATRLLPAESREANVLWPDGNGRLWLVARSDSGLSHAVYRYLEYLGCRWYFPSERWTIIPERDDILLPEPLATSPEFRSRMFSGTGGFGGNLPLDPERQLQRRWTDWQRRNRFGGEFRVSGHTGEAFNLKYRKQLEAHPEWRAMIDGERVPWSLTAKFCPANREVVDLYVRDRLEDYRNRRKRDREAPHAWAVSVEPADGGGHCTAPESAALGSVSDRVFHVANAVARAVRREFPDGHVSLFAYNQHAAVPSIPLEPNVYVQVIPYAFQRTGLSPDQLLDAWSAKVPRMGVYDYWSIPDWSHDLPSFDPLEFGPQRLRGWHRRGVDSFLCESTFSSGAMGPAWYITSRLAWQPDADVEALFEELLHDCFGSASAPMRRMLTRWASHFTLTSHELALSFRDIHEARQLAGRDNAVRARVADYGRYVIYLRRYFQYLQTQRGSAERHAAAKSLMTCLWSVYDSSMIHAFRLSQLLARDERLAGNSELATNFDWRKPDAPGWTTVEPLSDDEVSSLIDEGVDELQPQNFESRQYRGPLVRVPRVIPRENSRNPPPVLWLSNSLDFHVLAEETDFRFRPRIASQHPVQMLVTGPDGQPVASRSVVTGEDWRNRWAAPEVVLPRPGLYHVQFVSQKRTMRFSAPGDIPLTMPGWWNSQGTPTPRLYFFVPAGIGQLAIYTNYTAAGPPRFYNPEGGQVHPELVDNGHLMLIPISAKHQGQIWSLDRAKCAIGPLEMLNAPAAFAFSPETLLVPRDALRPVTVP